MAHSISGSSKQYEQLIAGLQQHAPNLVVTLASQVYTIPQIVAALQSLVAGNDSVADARAALHDAVLANEARRKQGAALVRGVITLVSVMYSQDADTLASFGLEPRKERRRLTPEQLAVRTAKAAATRLARGTTRKGEPAPSPEQPEPSTQPT